jgi:hypothetical protein
MKHQIAGENGHRMDKMAGTLDQLWSIIYATQCTPPTPEVNQL